MTCLEKLKQMYPDASLKELCEIVEDDCPSDYGIMSDPDRYTLCGTHECEACWNRQIPELDPKVEQTLRDALENGHGLSVTQILDSGSRQEFDTGAVRDIQEGKGRCDLMPLDVVAKVVEGGSGAVADAILDDIGLFQQTGDVGHLYYAIKVFTQVTCASTCTMLLEVSKHFEEGAKKYGENNWQKGLPVKCYINSAVRHYLKWLRGDTDEPHDRAFCWNILCAIWTCKHKPELNDYAVREEVPGQMNLFEGGVNNADD